MPDHTICEPQLTEDDELLKQQMELDQQVANAGKLQVIDEIDSNLRAVSDIELNKFLSKFDHTYMDRNKPKGPDYLVMDNFFENFDLNEADLLGARRDVE